MQQKLHKCKYQITDKIKSFSPLTRASETGFGIGRKQKYMTTETETNPYVYVKPRQFTSLMGAATARHIHAVPEPSRVVSDGAKRLPDGSISNK